METTPLLNPLMSNEELQDAIDKTCQMIYGTGSGSPTGIIYREHMTNLLTCQAKRASVIEHKHTK